jgi:hypothetical protein
MASRSSGIGSSNEAAPQTPPLDVHVDFDYFRRGLAQLDTRLEHLGRVLGTALPLNGLDGQLDIDVARNELLVCSSFYS